VEKEKSALIQGKTLLNTFSSKFRTI